MGWEKIFASHVSDEGLISEYIKNNKINLIKNRQ
jgi:hypothetical protein